MGLEFGLTLTLTLTLTSLAGAVSAFRVSLNGQQYGAPLTLGVHVAPTVSSRSSAPGPFGGGTRVDVHGASFDQRGHGTSRLA